MYFLVCISFGRGLAEDLVSELLSVNRVVYCLGLEGLARHS